MPVLVIVGVAALAWWQRHRLADLGSTLGHAEWGWIVLGIAAQAVSIGALARQQRCLLTVEGDRVPFRPVLATTYAGGAISLSLPLIGKAASVVYTYRRFAASGLRRAVIAWAVTMSAVFTTLTYITISAVGAIVTGDHGAMMTGVLSLVAVVAPVTMLLGALHIGTIRRRVERGIGAVARGLRRVTRRPIRAAEAKIAAAVETIASLRLDRRKAMAAAFWSVMNVAATILCLACSILAVDGAIPWTAIILVWAAASSISLLGLTPGGIGVVEVAASAALIAAGMGDATAIAAVLIYRGISFWLSLAAGGATLAAIRSRRHITAAA